MKTVLEKYGAAKYDVIYSADDGTNPRRIGHIIGARRVYLAEAGPLSLGYHKTLRAASNAILSHRGLANYTPFQTQQDVTARR